MLAVSKREQGLSQGMSWASAHFGNDVIFLGMEL